jgi:hypothetical protein
MGRAGGGGHGRPSCPRRRISRRSCASQRGSAEEKSETFYDEKSETLYGKKSETLYGVFLVGSCMSEGVCGSGKQDKTGNRALAGKH